MPRTSDELRKAILDVVPSLPPVFESREVAAAIGEEGMRALVKVRRMLDQLVAEHQLFNAYAFIPGSKGDHPAQWSADSSMTKERVMKEVVWSIIQTIPGKFRLRDVLSMMQMSVYKTNDVLTALESLASDNHVVKIRDRFVGRPGRTNVLWSTDACIIAEELRFRAGIEAQKKREFDATKALFDRLSDPLLAPR
jgi:hypothetical protein